MASKPNLSWIFQNQDLLKKSYEKYLVELSIENSYDTCFSYVQREVSTEMLKKQYGVSSYVELAKLLSGQNPNQYSH